MRTAIRCAEISMFQRFENGVFVFFCYVKNEGSEPCVIVFVILAPGDCASDCDYGSCVCFAYFDG